MKTPFLLLLPALLLLGGCGDSAKAPLHGYVEGDYRLIAAEAGGRLTKLAVTRGQTVAAGAPLFSVDDADQLSAVAQAEAKLAQAKADLADLQTGKRPEEIRVLDAQLAEAQANLVAAQKNFDRSQALVQRAVAADASLDQARAALDADRAQVDAARQNRDVANLPARPAQIQAAEQAVAAQQGALADAKTALDRRHKVAPAAGRIEDTYYQEGEIVAAGGPVVSLLPADGRKIIFYLPEAERSGVTPGTALTVACDGCAAGLAATITSVASDAEYTPPVIYSKESRAKLVYRVEARPEGAAQTLDPGQPVDITLAGR